MVDLHFFWFHPPRHRVLLALACWYGDEHVLVKVPRGANRKQPPGHSFRSYQNVEASCPASLPVPAAVPLQAMDGMPAPSYQSRPTDPYSLEETAGAMELVNSQFEATVKERADNEATQAEEVKRRAEEELDGFYDERTDEVRKRRGRWQLRQPGWYKCPQALAVWPLGMPHLQHSGGGGGGMHYLY